MKRISYIALAMLAVSCGTGTQYDAQGTFEATEVVVSSEAAGRILDFNVEEGMPVTGGAVVGEIDSLQLHLQRKQLSAQLSALIGSRPDIKAQAASLREQIAKQQTECNRVRNMLRDGAATQKLLDDIEAQIRVLESQLTATLSTLGKNTASINDNAAALEAQIDALDDRIAKCRITSPVGGTVLVKYAETGELASVGKPLMKIADLDNIYLRAYFTSDQLGRICLISICGPTSPPTSSAASASETRCVWWQTSAARNVTTTRDVSRGSPPKANSPRKPSRRKIPGPTWSMP